MDKPIYWAGVAFLAVAVLAGLYCALHCLS